MLARYDSSLEDYLLDRITMLSADLQINMTSLDNTINELMGDPESTERAQYYRENVLAAMSGLRFVVDDLESLIAKKHWPLPSYADLLYSVV